MSTPLTASCPCGACHVTLDRAPRHRLYCHCSVCQRVYGQPFADVTVLPARAVTLPKGSALSFDRYKSPPAIRRGTCPACDGPVVGFMSYGPGLKVAYIPASALSEPPVTHPRAHLFYKTRVEDVADNLPKISGTLASFVAGTPLVLGALFSRG